MKDPPTPPGSAQPPRDQTCQHCQQCPDARAPDRIAARAVASHPEQGWSLLCNDVVLFDARISCSSGSTKTAHPGRLASTRHCASCQPHIECRTVECAHCGDGLILTGALVDQLRKHDPNQPTALRAWLTSHE